MISSNISIKKIVHFFAGLPAREFYLFFSGIPETNTFIKLSPKFSEEYYF